jgi:hypothetical protein
MVAAALTAGGRAAIMAEVCNVTFSPGRISQRADRMAAAGLTEPRDASERGLAMGGGRPAERRFTVGGSGKSVARCNRTVLAYWKFESISLQRRVNARDFLRCIAETLDGSRLQPPAFWAHTPIAGIRTEIVRR